MTAHDIPTLLKQALDTGRWVLITYTDSDGKETERRVLPNRIYPPYVEAYCDLRKEDRSFRLDRISSVRIGEIAQPGPHPVATAAATRSTLSTSTEHPSDLADRVRLVSTMADLDRAIAARPDDPDAHYARGERHFRRKSYDSALADLSRAIELNPGYARAFAIRAAAYHSLARYSEALADIDRALAIDDGDVRAFTLRGEVCLGLGRYNEALVDLNRAVSLDPCYASAYVALGATYHRMDLDQPAIESLEKARELNPYCGSTVAMYGEVCLKLGRFDMARNAFTYAVQLGASCPGCIKRVDDAERTRQAGG